MKNIIGFLIATILMLLPLAYYYGETKHNQGRVEVMREQKLYNFNTWG